MEFTLNPQIDAGRMAEQFARSGHVVVEKLVPDEQAHWLLRNLEERDDWVQILNSGDKVIELDRSVRRAMDRGKQLKLEEAVFQAARYGFQYRYEGIRVPDSLGEVESQAGDPLMQFGAFMRSAPVIALLREICGDPLVAFTDAQGTAYGPGDFLTAHDDDVQGKHRIAAYVYGLNPSWRPEWGGLLLFQPEGATGGQFVTPGFNILTLFKVPQAHSVSQVAPFTPRRRYSVTGWARSRGPEEAG